MHTPNGINKKLVFFSLIGAMLLSLGVFANAQSDAVHAPDSAAILPANAGPQVTAVNHLLKATYISTCLPGCTTFSIAGGTAVPLDAVTTINCPAPIGKTCTITDDAWIELQNTGGSDNPEALGFYLDGVDADFLYNGSSGTPGGSFFDGLAHKTAVATVVSRGSHTVQTLTYSVLGANASGWTATYRVYVP